MTAVYVRHEYDADAKYLADVPFEALDSVIPTIARWGIDGEQPELSGQFSCGEAGVHFEVIIHADDTAP